MRVLLLIVWALVTVAGAAAQGTDSFAYNGIEFELPQDLAAGVLALRIPGDDPSLQQPGGPIPTHIAFTFMTGAPNPETNVERGTLRIFNTADFNGYSQFDAQLVVLSGLLETRPDLTSYTQVATDGTNSFDLPFLPSVGAAQIMRAKPQYIDTEFLTGVRYLTIYASDVSPFTADRVWYTFQGLSTDGTRYIAATFPVNASALPASIAADFNYDEFNANYVQYLTDTVILLNDAAVESFSPSPLALDALVQSIRLPMQQIIDAGGTVSLGGLEGTWNLTSFGAADTQQPLLEIAPITLTFAPDGISGSGGCNSYFGAFSFENDGLSFDGVGSTLMACEQAVMDQESTYFTALRATNGYSINEDQLLIFYGDGAGEVAPGVLTFTRAGAE
jgi:heat shock protein HslJ